jgi:DNA invertase Pin-like site-specific DNA recombinase
MKNLRAIKAITINRVSTAEQAKDEKYSLPAQVEDNREYCKKKGLDIIKEFTFDESATADKRKKFEEAIKLIKASSEPIAMVADRVDRFQRGWKETVEFDDLRRNGQVELHFVRQGLVIHRNSDPYELMGWDAHVMFARAYVLQLKANVKKGIKGKLEKGQFPGYAITGYKNVAVTNGDGSIVKEIHVDEDKAKYVKMCFDLYATEKYTVGELAEKMKDLGFQVKAKKTKNGNGDGRDITKNDVLCILHNPFPTGEFYWPDPETGERKLYSNKGTYPTLITKKLYEKVQTLIASNNTRHNGFKKNNFKFRGLLKCHFCGSTLTPEEMSRTYGENSKSKNINQVYYHCSNGKALVDSDYYEKKFGTDHSGVHTYKQGKRKGQTVIGCPQKWWKEEEIEEFILHEFDAMHYDDEVYEILKIFLKKDYEKRMEEADKSIRGLRNKLGKVGKIIDGLMDKIALTKDKRLEEDLGRRYNNLKKEQEDLRDQMKSYEDGKGIDTDKTIDAMKLACDLKKHYLGLPFEKQRELLSMCFDHIVACKGEWRVNGGRGKRVKAKSLYPVLNEPFVTLQSVNLLDEIFPLEEAYVKNPELTKKMREMLVAQREKRKQQGLTKNKDSKASPFP